jgi:DNA replication protein DnaC
VAGWEVALGENGLPLFLPPKMAYLWRRGLCACERAAEAAKNATLDAARAQRAEAALIARKRRLVETSGLSRELLAHCFENFEPVNASTRAALYICQHWAEQYNETVGTGLMLAGLPSGGGNSHYSGAGNGKTTLVCAILNYLREEKQVDGQFWEITAFYQALFEEFGLPEKERRVVRRCQEVPVLALDDLGRYRSENAWVGRQLFSVINHRVNAGLPILVTTNFRDNQIEEQLGPDGPPIVSRLTAVCQPVRIDAPDQRRSGGRKGNRCQFISVPADLRRLQESDI